MFILIPTIFIIGVSCGGKDSEELATAGDLTVTIDDFRVEFNSLSPSEQVEVLAPFGKLDLVTRLIYREMLLAEAEQMDNSKLSEWLSITELTRFSQDWHLTAMNAFDVANIDSILVDSLLRTHFTLSAVLLEDSLSAEQVKIDWIANAPSEPLTGMALAPWSINGNSYIDIQSDLFTFITSDPVFAGYAVPYLDSGVTVFPAYGVWAVLKMNPAEQSDADISFTLNDVAPHIFNSTLAEEAGVIIMSDAVRDFSLILQTAGGHYFIPDTAVYERSMQLAIYEGGDITAGEVASLIDLLQDNNFRDEIPTEYSYISFGPPLLGVETDLWRYVNHLAMIFWKADMGRRSGLVLEDADRELTITDYVIREMVIIPAMTIDSTDIMSYYENNTEFYALPELRAVELVYVPRELIDVETEYDTFESLPDYYSSLDSMGELIPTRTIPAHKYGPLGDSIFNADLNEFEGPIEFPGTDMYAFFRVVEIVPPGNSNPNDIYDVLYDDYRVLELNRLLGLYLEELWAKYEVKIDSAMVDTVDPWQSNY